jgi:hypothetical protein
LIFSGNPTGSGVVYMDNVLFHNAISGIETIQANEMTLYPNPVQNELTIANSEELASVQIYSLTGENILIQTEMASDKIDVSQLESGIYICVMETISGEILQAKFIKD